MVPAFKRCGDIGVYALNVKGAYRYRSAADAGTTNHHPSRRAKVAARTSVLEW
jgi:hypothetical protein